MENRLNDRQQPTIEFWFEFGSNYSYLSVMRIEEAAALKGVTVQWRPFLLGPIFQSFGWSSSPFVLQQAKGAYTWKDMQRQCTKYSIPWRKPSVFPRPATLPMKVAAAYADEPWIGMYCKAFMTKNFALDQDFNSWEQVREVLVEVGVSPQEIIDSVVSGNRKNLLRESTDEAVAKGIFGAPTFFVRGEMFWGNDRLDDALVFAASE